MKNGICRVRYYRNPKIADELCLEETGLFEIPKETLPVLQARREDYLRSVGRKASSLHHAPELPPPPPPPPTPSFQRGDYIEALSSDRQRWFPGQVMKVSEDGSRVQLVLLPDGRRVVAPVDRVRLMGQPASKPKVEIVSFAFVCVCVRVFPLSHHGEILV